MKKILKLAHRGYSGRYPENTRIAFESAFEQTNCDGIESDVHFSKDGKLVIIHDPVLNRTSNGTGFVKDHTYEELLQLDLGSWMGEQFAGQRIMLWSELLDLCRETGKICNLEIKNYEVFYDGIEKAVIEEIERQKMQDRVFLSSFNHVSMEACKRINPEIEIGLLYDKPLYDTAYYVSRTISDCIHPRYSVLQFEPHLVEDFHRMGRKVNVWTANEKQDIHDMIDLGVDSIISNFPDRLDELVPENG